MNLLTGSHISRDCREMEIDNHSYNTSHGIHDGYQYEHRDNDFIRMAMAKINERQRYELCRGHEYTMEIIFIAFKIKYIQDTKRVICGLLLNEQAVLMIWIYIHITPVYASLPGKKIWKITHIFACDFHNANCATVQRWFRYWAGPQQAASHNLYQRSQFGDVLMRTRGTQFMIYCPKLFFRNQHINRLHISLSMIFYAQAFSINWQLGALA